MGINAAKLVAVRGGIPDLYGRAEPECMAAGQWTRAAFNGVKWGDADAARVLVQTAVELVLNAKRGQIIPIDLAKKPEIATFLAHIDTAELRGGQ